ncbi:hypothetical protein IRJ41_003122 [Triplophysa rosa]|uniref:Uncharacterized protein n=1 Tax=Triplophysa rosa TaxID=992332 RepID=A0A9W8C1M4_TRIRA|nr:hypothetical protein IRJ41_003122 [Triplophysa rosa]
MIGTVRLFSFFLLKGQKFGPGPAGPPGEHFSGFTAQVTSGEIQRHPQLFNIKEICRGAELKHNASQC